MSPLNHGGKKAGKITGGKPPLFSFSLIFTLLLLFIFSYCSTIALNKGCLISKFSFQGVE